jgi:hypothetical protein
MSRIASLFATGVSLLKHHNGTPVVYHAGSGAEIQATGLVQSEATCHEDTEEGRDVVHILRVTVFLDEVAAPTVNAIATVNGLIWSVVEIEDETELSATLVLSRRSAAGARRAGGRSGR